MRLSLSTETTKGHCSGCNTWGPVVQFTVVTPEHTGDVDPICPICLFDTKGTFSQVPMRELVSGPTPRRRALRKNKRISQRQESELAEELGARVQPNSGAMAGAKGDVRKKGQFLLEAKFTSADSYSLKLAELEKVAGECRGLEKPVLVIDYRESGTSTLKDRFAVFRFDDAKELLHDTGKHR